MKILKGITLMTNMLYYYFLAEYPIGFIFHLHPMQLLFFICILIIIALQRARAFVQISEIFPMKFRTIAVYIYLFKILY